MVTFRGRVSSHGGDLAHKPQGMLAFPMPPALPASGINQTLARQASEVRAATARLHAMEQDSALASRLSARDSANGDADSLVKRVSRSLAAADTGLQQQHQHQQLQDEAGDAEAQGPSARVDFPEILDLLLASLDGQFEPQLHRQKCASPVPLTESGDAFESFFYVAKDRLHAKLEDAAHGIPVRYQGFTKSTVWFSEARPQWGIVARRMQHQARVKQHNSADEAEAMASRAALFFHVFEGFSYVLVRRPAQTGPLRKGDLGALVVEDAAKIVQLWPMRGAATSLRQPSAVGAQPKKAQQQQQETKQARAGPSRKRALSDDSWAPDGAVHKRRGSTCSSSSARSSQGSVKVEGFEHDADLASLMLPEAAPGSCDLLEEDLQELHSLFADSSDGALSDGVSDLDFDDFFTLT